MTSFVQITINQVSPPQVTLLLKMVLMSSWRVQTLHLVLTLLVLINGLRVVQVRQSVVNLHLHMTLVTRGPLPDPILVKWFLRIVEHLLHPLQKLFNFIVSTVLWDPPSGPMYPFQSVCSSVCYKSSHTYHHQFCLISCNTLACSKSKKVRKPDFPGKLWILFIFNFSKYLFFFDHFLNNASLVSAEISYLDSSQHYVQLFYSWPG